MNIVLFVIVLVGFCGTCFFLCMCVFGFLANRSWNEIIVVYPKFILRRLLRDTPVIKEYHYIDSHGKNKYELRIYPYKYCFAFERNVNDKSVNEAKPENIKIMVDRFRYRVAEEIKYQSKKTKTAEYGEKDYEMWEL